MVASVHSASYWRGGSNDSHAMEVDLCMRSEKTTMVGSVAELASLRT